MGKASGAAKGAAEGFLMAAGQMGYCGGDFCGVAALFWVATAGTFGAVYGAAKVPMVHSLVGTAA